MEQLIPLVNKLQDALALADVDEPINLPQIVVVGSQSSGKSSVLESLVGRDFLPRGSGIVTRRPLILQLMNTKDMHLPSGESQAQEWGEFMHTGQKKYTDFNAIRAEIENETDREVGKNKGVSEKPINLRIYSPRVLNLTLVDLPGLTRVAVGDQPRDIEALIRKMVRRFITNPNSIILAVSAANVDLANSDALNLAREVDPDGLRTVGVLTKLDLMDKGTDALDILQGRVYPLRLGFIGVVNRSQHDINTSKSIDEALKFEKEYFEKHPLYSSLKSRSGYTYLANTLNRILLQTIRETLPELKQNLTARLRTAQDALQELGDAQMNQSKSALLLNILTRYSSIYGAVIDGQLPDLPLDSLYGGSRINYIFIDVFGKHLEQMKAIDNLSSDEMRIALTNAAGPRMALFMPEAAFDYVVKKQILMLEKPALECADLVLEELISIANKIDIPELRRFSALRERISEVMHGLLTTSHVPAKTMITNLIKIERDYINISHPDFIGGDRAIDRAVKERSALDAAVESKEMASSSAAQKTTPSKNVPADIPKEVQQKYVSARDEALIERTRREEASRKEEESSAQKDRDSKEGFFSRLFKPKAQPAATSSAPENKPRITQPPATITASSIGSTAPSDFHTHVLTILLTSYFDIVRKSIRDRVPKTLMHFMVTHSKTNLQTELVRQLYKEDLFDELLRESSDVASRRQKHTQTEQLLKKVLGLLGEVEANKW